MGAPELIIGCGILHKEIQFLIEKNNWHLETAWFPSGLHVDFDKLEQSLSRGLQRHKRESAVVFYGACHPCMDQILRAAGVIRTPGQNCVDIYLGHDMFCRELEQGAFFLFEDWAINWNKIVGSIMPGAPEIMRSIFRDAHSYLLAIRTPCSGDFSAEAEAVSLRTDLELRWVDIGLEHLEANLAMTLDRAKAGKP
jgi:hypothetical protein